MTLPFTPPGSLRPLRPHQGRALGGAPSFAGALAIVARCFRRRPARERHCRRSHHRVERSIRAKRIAFVVPRLTLIDQTVAAFEAEGIDAIGVMQGCHYRTDGTQPVQVCQRADPQSPQAPRG